jgi:membrane fusion protein (multidrug efflux system)
MSVRHRQSLRVSATRSAVALAASFAVLTLSGCGKKAAPAPEPTAINVVQIANSDVPVYDEFVGQTEAPYQVEIRARVDGYIDKIAFTEGANVKTGALLFQLDPRPFQAALDNAKAELAKAKAQLQRAQESVDVVRARAALVADEASLLNAQQNLGRVEPLAGQRAVTQAQLDAASAQEKEAQARVTAGRALVQQTELTQKTDIDAAKAVVEAGNAAVKTAELNLAYTTIRAPMSGRIGRANVEVGSFAQVGQADPLTIINTTEEIYVNFSITERQYLELQAKINAIETASAKREGQLDLILANGEVWPHKGKVNLTDTQVNAETGTLGLRAVFPNPGGVVKPGQFAKVRTVIEQATDVVVIPAQAVQDLLGARFVYVVNDENIVVRRDVVPGQQVGQMWIIDKGLSPGERVIVEGIQKVRPDAKVNPTVVPLASTGPSNPAPQAPAAS